MTDRETVLVRHPEATLREEVRPMAYFPWVVLYHPQCGLIAGGGPTPDEAWRNAAIHTRAVAEREAKERAERQRGTPEWLAMGLIGEAGIAKLEADGLAGWTDDAKGRLLVLTASGEEWAAKARAKAKGEG